MLLSVLEKQQHLPDVMFLQLDNTARENKNQFVLSFLALLVVEGIFSEENVYSESFQFYHEGDYVYNCKQITYSLLFPFIDPSQLFDGGSYPRGY